MKIEHTKSLFRRTRKIACIFLLCFLTINCTRKEPAFTVKGDESITKDIKVNVEVITENGTTLATAFYNGKSYDIENQNALRYKIYVSYKNRFFYSIEADNLHGKVKGEPINEIVIATKQDSVTVLYKPLKESTNTDGKIMKPANVFFANTNQENTEKPKFTSLYKNK